MNAADLAGILTAATALVTAVGVLIAHLRHTRGPSRKHGFGP